MANYRVAVVCLLVLTAGCASLGGSGTSNGADGATATPTPGTATPTPLDLPDGIDPVEVDRLESLSTAQQDAFRQAQGNDEWVLIEQDTAQRLDAMGYVYADGRLWSVRVRQGTDAFSITQADDDPEDVTGFANLTARQQALFERAVEDSPYALGPDEEFVSLPAHVEYQGQVYAVSAGTESWGLLGLDVDPYESSG